MWRDHPFSQRSITTERAVGVGVGDNRKEGRVGQNLKKAGLAIWQYEGGGGSS